MMGLMWYLMGMATTAAIWGYLVMRGRFEIRWQGNAGLFACFALAWLCVGWSWGSFAEGEPQSGAMGLLFFGLGALLVGQLTLRRWVWPNRR